jgi:hypothetical protein
MMADGAFDQAAIDLMIEAYESICQELHLTESKYHPANEAVANAVIALVREGERDVQRIAQCVVQSVRPPQA